MATKPDDCADEYLEPYREALMRFGPTFDATLWRNKETQVVRFDVLHGMLDPTGLTVLDAGCALGDFCEFLRERGVRYGRYVGIDALPRLIECAARRGLPRAEFIAGDFVARPDLLRAGAPDVIYFSGSLNTVPEAKARGIVARAYEIAARAVVFNFLSDRCLPRESCESTGAARRFNTLDWLDWALGATVNVRFRQEYLEGHDATIALLKPRAGCAKT